MPGSPQKRLKKLENLGLAKLEEATQGIVHKYLAEDHPLSLTKTDAESMHALADMSNDDYKRYLIDLLKLNTSKLATRIAVEVDNIPTRHLPIAFGILMDKLRDLQGEPTQRVEVTRKGLSPDEFNKLLDALPKERMIDVTDTGDTKFKKSPSTTPKDQSKDQP
tara:strand:+ start:163 stop:654 length:492 start_codon:yes stop_codon:yes gene_type:complete